MGKDSGRYKKIAANRKFEIHVLDPKDGRRDNVRVTLHPDDGPGVHHHFRSYEIARLIAALEESLAYGPAIPER